jgi:hypothetical protein
LASTERPEQLATAEATMLATTTTCSEQLVDQTTKGAEPTMMTANMVELTMGKDAINVATMEVTEQEAPGQVAPEQSLTSTLIEGHLSMEQGHAPRLVRMCPSKTRPPRARLKVVCLTP